MLSQRYIFIKIIKRSLLIKKRSKTKDQEVKIKK